MSSSATATVHFDLTRTATEPLLSPNGNFVKQKDLSNGPDIHVSFVPSLLVIMSCKHVIYCKCEFTTINQNNLIVQYRKVLNE